MEISTIMLDSDTFLVIKGVTEYRQILIRDIISVEAADKYVSIQTSSGIKFTFLSSMKEVSKYLINFIKVNKGFIVNRYYIMSLTKNPKDTDKYVLAMFDGASGKYSIEISSYLAKKVIEQL